jgi:iron complex outermembrane receptor protein
MQFEHGLLRVRLAMACVLVIIGLPPSAFAQDQAESIPTIVVTGSYIRRTTDQGALPVTVLTEEDIRRTGANTTEQLLQSLAPATQGNSNTVTASAAGLNTAGVSGISLRGLGSQRTLVLINGRRSSAGGTLTDSTTVDANSIPLAAVERVDVLKDGASATYGSDAIAGVVNFVLRDDYEGQSVTVNYGDSAAGGAQSRRANAVFGFGNLDSDRYNVLVVANYLKEDPLFGYQRSFARSAVNLGAQNDGTSGNSFPANIVIPTVDENGDPTTVTANPNHPNCSPSIADPVFDAFGAPFVCRYDPSPLVGLLPATERSNVYATGKFAFNANLQGYAEASFAHNRVNTVIQGSPVSDQFAIPPTHPLVDQAPYNGGAPGVGFATISLSPTSQFYPTAFVQDITGGPTPDVLVRYRTVEIGNRDFTDTSDITRGVVGVRAQWGAWDFNAPLLYAKTELTEHINAGIELYTRLLPLLNSGTVNFFGPNTPAVKAQLDATQFIGDAYTTESSLTSFAPTLSRDLTELRAGPLALAIGAELRNEKFATKVAAPLQIGDTTQYGGSNLPVSKSRDVTSVFAELDVPVTKTLGVDAAVRYDDYENTGSKAVPKVSVRWQPIDRVLVRGSFGRGFRAPSLSELYQPQITGVSTPGLNDPARCGSFGNDSRDCLTQFNILLGGNTELRPEESDNYTLGVVFKPLTSLSVGLDAFKVKLKETIIFGIDPDEILNDPQFASFITREPPSNGLPGHILQIDQRNLNFGETHVTGLDVDLRWQSRNGVTIAMNGTYFDTFEIQNLDGTFTSVNGRVSPIVNGAGGAIPRWHHYLSVNWGIGHWDLTAAQNYQRSYEDIPGNAGDLPVPRTVSAYMTHDLQASYTGLPKLRPSFGVRNVFDEDPPYTNAGGSNFFQAGYDPGYADPRGRFYYATVTFSFGT